MRKVDPAIQRTFVKSLEDKLNTAQANNPTLIVAWELLPELSQVNLILRSVATHDPVIDHLGASLVRLLNVGKKLGLVERDLVRLEITCFSQKGKKVLFSNGYLVP